MVTSGVPHHVSKNVSKDQSQGEIFKLLTLTFDRWLRESEAYNYDELYNLILLEQFKKTL